MIGNRSFYYLKLELEMTGEAIQKCLDILDEINAELQDSFDNETHKHLKKAQEELDYFKSIDNARR